MQPVLAEKRVMFLVEGEGRSAKKEETFYVCAVSIERLGGRDLLIEAQMSSDRGQARLFGKLTAESISSQLNSDRFNRRTRVVSVEVEI